MNTLNNEPQQEIEYASLESFAHLKDRSGSKTPMSLRKKSRRAKNKVARASRKLNRK